MENDLLKSLSPSAVNAFLDYRTMWFYTKILKRRLPDTCDMARGNAVEAAINAFLKKDGNAENSKDETLIQECLDWALQSFDDATDLIVDEDKEEMRASISGLAKLGIETIVSYGEPVAIQRKVSCYVQGVQLPWLGFLDYVFKGTDGKVRIVDLKVTGKTPSKLSPGHGRQGAFYEYALTVDGFDVEGVEFLYLIPLKKEMKAVKLPLENSPQHMKHLIAAAQAMENLVARYSVDELKEVYMPSPADWWITDKEGKYHAGLEEEFKQFA
jgi:hypothetical protein